VIVRIGELLLTRVGLPPDELARALDEQARNGGRLCSLLISRGAIDFDIGAVALGDQRGVPCALAKHLANRDTSAAQRIPAELGRKLLALPIGYNTSGALVVAVRDPDPGLRAALQTATGGDIAMVVTPATRLERLIAGVYGGSPEEFDVDLDSRVDVPALTPTPAPVAQNVPHSTLAPPVAAPPTQPPLPDIDLLNPDTLRFALSPLDDTRVAKDHEQSGGMLAMQNKSMQSKSGLTHRQRGILPPAAPTLSITRAALARAATRDAATDAAMAFIAGRWRSAIIVAVRDRVAIGYRGHGVADVSELELPVDEPSTIERVVTTRQVSTEVVEAGAIDVLARALNVPTMVAAAPVVVGGSVIAVIAVGDSIHGIADTSAVDELGALSIALGEAYDRIRASR